MLSHRNSYSVGSAPAAYGFRSAAPTQTTRASAAPIREGHSAEYEAPWPIYALDWVKWPHANLTHRATVALGSFLEESSNKLQVLGLNPLGDRSVELGANSPYDFVKIAEADHEYPITKVLWEPLRSGKSNANLIATSADHLRLWELTGDQSIPGTRNKGIIMKALCHSPKTEFSAPLTSFHWNREAPNLIVTASIDTTCTVWDLNTLHAKTHLIAHDKEVFDVAFVAGSEHIFASCGADGSVRMFDLRSLDHSTIIYESPQIGLGSLSTSTSAPISRSTSAAATNTGSPLLRLSPCSKDANLLATFHLDSSIVLILDIRQPGKELYNLVAHTGNINAVQWAPSSRHILVSGGDDQQALVWDLSRQNPGGRSQSGTIREPKLVYNTESEINNLTWGLSASGGSAETVGMAYGKTFQAVSIVL